MLFYGIWVGGRHMNTEAYVKLIFSNMVCSCCDNPFTADSVEIIRIEDNCAVVKIVYSHCEKNYGIVIVGIEKINLQDNIEDLAEEQVSDLPPITTDDVIEAHKFIDNLGADWAKYIPEEYK